MNIELNGKRLTTILCRKYERISLEKYEYE